MLAVRVSCEKRYAADAETASRILLSSAVPGCAARCLLGRRFAFAMQDGTADIPLCSRLRYVLGLCPTSSVNRELNEPRDVQPTAMQVSVTLEPLRSRAIARSIRRVIR